MSTCRATTRLLFKPSKPLLPTTQCRHESTARRHRKLLHLPEAPSYTPSKTAPSLIYNPPSSAPSVYHTPSKFLPKTDKRKALFAAAQAYATLGALARKTPFTAAPGTPLHTVSHLPPKPSAYLPPAVRTPYEKTYHLTQADIDEMRRLRAEDPDVWTRVKLAERFGCSQFFVGLVAKNGGKAERVEREHEMARGRWG
ncbi:hypothetical protein P154DRAFT_213286, partial [Amniculicola lignicola CBS 123094]